MPNRMLRDWTESEKMKSLGAPTERFFVRLIMKVDDYGCFHANTSLLKANLFPLLLDEIREADIARWMAECQKAGLIVLYEAGGKKYLQIQEFRQRLDKARRKYPLPDSGKSVTTVNDFPGEGEEEEKKKTEPEGEGAGARPPIPEAFSGIVIYDAEEEILKSPISLDALCCAHGKSPEQGREILKKYHLHLTEKDQYPKSKKAAIAGFTKWLMNEKNFTNGTNVKRGSGPGLQPGGQDPTRIVTEGFGSL